MEEHDPFDHANGDPVEYSLVDADTVVGQYGRDLTLLGGLDFFTGQAVVFALAGREANDLFSKTVPPVMIMVPDYAIQQVDA